MEQPRNGGDKVVTFEQASAGRRRNGSLSVYLDIGWEADAGRAARALAAQGMGSRRRTFADGELDVFAAERYFKGAMDGDGDRREGGGATAVVVPVEAASAKPAVAVAKPAGSRASTRSVGASSAASANSQTVLLRRGLRQRGSREGRCCVQVGALMRTCSGKRSVPVDGGAAAKEAPASGEPAAASKIDWYRELTMQKAALGLAFDGVNHGVVAAAGLPPSLNLGAAKVAAIGREDGNSGSRRRSFTLVAPVRANAAAGGRGGGGKGGGHERGDDDDDGAGSESSSDLFEIKSLMIEDCHYEPSEASIQWSVVTASAAGASDRGGDRVAARWVTGAGSNGGRAPPAGGWQHRERPVGLLSGCVSHRAVDVSAVTVAGVPSAPAAAMAMRRRAH